MADSRPSSPGSTPEAERVFFDLLAPDGACDPRALDAACAARPELAVDLHSLRKRHERGRELIAGLGGASGAPGEALPRFEERYQIRGEIARGGMGVVLEVWDAKLRRTLAMKTLRKDRDAADALALERRRARLWNEAQALAQLEHPGIVPIYDVGLDARGEVYFTMLHVRGRSLHEVFRAVRGASAEWNTTRAIGVLLRVCEAVAHAHEQGVLHRDLKPSNVMVGPFGETYVLDWGLSRVGPPAAAVAGKSQSAAVTHPSLASAVRAALPVRTDRSDARDSDSSSPLLTQEGEALGTPAYMSPEQAGGHSAALDGRADVYSLGAMLYELLAGAPPYEHELAVPTPQAVRQAALDRAPLALERAARDAPAELVAICEKAMARAPEGRYASLRAMADDLRAYLEGRVVGAHRTGAWAELCKWVARNRLAAAATAATALALVAFLVLQSISKREVELARRSAEERAEALRREDYANRVALASVALGQADVPRLRDLLDGCPADLRGPEWSLLDRHADTSVACWPVSRADPNNVLLMPDGRTAVVSTLDQARGGDNRIALWDVERGREVCELERYAGPNASSLSWNLRTGTLAAFPAPRELRLWRAADWHLRATLDSDLSDWQFVRISPSGRWLVAGGQPRLELWDLARWERERILDPQRGRCVSASWAPDESRLYTGMSDGRVLVWDCAAWSLSAELAPGSTLVNVAASPDGRWLACGGQDRRFTVFDASLLAEVHRGQELQGHVGVAWSPDSSTLAVLVGPVVRLVEAGSWIERDRLVGHHRAVNAIAFSADASRIVSVSIDGTLRVWDLADPARPLLAPPSGADPAALSFSGSGEVLAVTWRYEGRIDIWSVPRRRIERTHELGQRLDHAELSPDGRHIAANATLGGVIVVDVSTGARARPLPALRAYEAHWSPDGAWLGLVASDGTIGVWSATTWQERWRVVLDDAPDFWPGRLRGPAWSPDGRQVVISTRDGRVQVRNAADGTLERELRHPSGHLCNPCFDPKGRTLLLAIHYSTRSGVEARDARDLTLRWRVGAEGMGSLNFDSEGTRLYVPRPGRIQCLDPADGRQLCEFPLLEPAEGVVAASPAENLLVTASAAGVRFLSGAARR